MLGSYYNLNFQQLVLEAAATGGGRGGSHTLFCYSHHISLKYWDPQPDSKFA